VFHIRKNKVGDGQRSLFWKDRWLNGHAASDFAPGLTLTVSARIANSRTVAHACLQNQWLLDIPGTLAA
jgi:hypothetical protein